MHLGLQRAGGLCVMILCYGASNEYTRRRTVTCRRWGTVPAVLILGSASSGSCAGGGVAVGVGAGSGAGGWRGAGVHERTGVGTRLRAVGACAGVCQ